MIVAVAVGGSNVAVGGGVSVGLAVGLGVAVGTAVGTTAVATLAATAEGDGCEGPTSALSRNALSEFARGAAKDGRGVAPHAVSKPRPHHAMPRAWRGESNGFVARSVLGARS